MENNNNKEENNKSDKNANDSDLSDLYANPFSNSNEKDENDIKENSQKENGINEKEEKNNLNIIENNKTEVENIAEKINENNNINEENIKIENKLDNLNINEKNDNNKNNNNTVKLQESNINTQNKNQPEKKSTYFIIKETGSNIYIENVKKMSSIAIEKSFNKIYQVLDFNEVLNLNIIKQYSVDAILGIIDINGNNKYILVVSSSKLIANIIGADIYNIFDVDLIKITLFDESENERNRITGVKKLFQSKNFYYSNKIDLCQNLFIKNRKNIINDFCVNSSLLKYFFDNSISSEFYTKIIYGYIGFKKNTQISNDKNLVMVDNLIIERVNKHLKFNSEIANHMKQIEFICMYKRNNSNSSDKNKFNINVFTFVFYVSNEIANNNVSFNPWNNFMAKELSRYPNIVCVVHNNVNMNLNNNININNNSIKNIIINSNQFGSKIKLLNFTSDWKKNLYFDSNNNSNDFIKSGSNNPNIIQNYVFWFIDINNPFNENDYCFNTIIRLMWKAMQQQIDSMKLGINIGPFNKSNNQIICNKFKELIMDYHNDLDMNKKPIYKSQMKKQLQKVYDYYFNNYSKNNITKSNVYEKNFNNNTIIQNNNNQINNLNDNVYFNNNNINAYQNFNYNQNNNNYYNPNPNMNNRQNNQHNGNNLANPFLQEQRGQMNQTNNNFMRSRTQTMENNHKYNMNNNIYMNEPAFLPKLNILCVTWNIGGMKDEQQIIIRDLFTDNIFHRNKKIPDIIVVGLQEIVELDIYNILSITSNEDTVNSWTQNLLSTINSIYPYTFKQISILNLVGIYCIILAQSHLKEDIAILDTKVVKTGLFGTLGNKGYLIANLRLFKKIEISFAVAHLEAGKDSNDERISTLKQILNTELEGGKIFKNSDFWIILGDLNFRIETSFEKSFDMIQRRDFGTLYEFDQLYLCRLSDGGLNDVNEARITFPPTYKYISGSNNYLNDIQNLRTPSWTDRVLFCHKNNIRNLDYSNIPSIMYSDHRAVQASFEINLQPKNKMNGPGFYCQSNKNNNFSNPFLKDNWNNPNFSRNNFNMNNNIHNNNGFNNDFGNNNYNNNQMNMNGNFNNNFNGSMNNHRNNQTNIYQSQRNNFNFNNNVNNNINQMNQNNEYSSQQNQQQGIEFDKVNKNKTLIIPGNNNQNNNNKNDEDNDNIDNIMKFFK